MQELETQNEYADNPGLRRYAIQSPSRRIPKRGISMNKFVLHLLDETLLTGKRKKYHDDLDHLAGTWTEKEAEEFEAHISDFEKIDPDDWK